MVINNRDKIVLYSLPLFTAIQGGILTFLYLKCGCMDTVKLILCIILLIFVNHITIGRIIR
jgi:hypothetical protein